MIELIAQADGAVAEGIFKYVAGGLVVAVGTLFAWNQKLIAQHREDSQRREKELREEMKSALTAAIGDAEKDKEESRRVNAEHKAELASLHADNAAVANMLRNAHQQLLLDQAEESKKVYAELTTLNNDTTRTIQEVTSILGPLHDAMVAQTKALKRVEQKLGE